MTDLSQRDKVVFRLRALSKENDEVRAAVIAAADRFGVGSMAELAERHPDLFDVFAEGIMQMVEDLPWT